jgi:hypothetical protein
MEKGLQRTILDFYYIYYFIDYKGLVYDYNYNDVMLIYQKKLKNWI